MTQRDERTIRPGDKNVPHGTNSGYSGYGCRCGACRAAHAAAARAAGWNRRVGRTADAKRDADAKLRHPCADCGTSVSRTAVRCVTCDRDRGRERRREIERRWQAGETLREIAVALGSTVNSIGSTLADMRREGAYDVPCRPPGGLKRRKAMAA